METGVKVGDIMTRSFAWVLPKTNLKECARTMVRKRVGSLIITEKDELKGIITEKDIVWAVVKKSSKHLDEIEVKDLMKRKVVTVKPSADIIEAMQKFKKKKVRRLPVIEQGKVIGILTQQDILKIDPGLFEMLAETIRIKEETAKIKKRGSPSKQGICEECGRFDLLYKDELQSLCEACFKRR